MERKKTPDMKELLTGTPSTPDTLRTPSKPSTPEYEKKTFIVKTGYIEKIKNLAYWERREIKEIVNEALEQYLKDKKIKSIPDPDKEE